MTVSTEISHEEYTGNGVTTTFPYRFRITNSSFMLVKTADLDGNEATLVLNTDYTLTGVKAYSGGNVILTNALPIGWRILLERNMPLLQGTDLRNQGSYFAEVHEDAFDYMTMLIQKVAGWFNLALRRPSWISNHYDAQGYKISNVNTPTAAQDAANKSYVDGEIGSANANAEALFGRTLRVPGSYIAPLPPLADGEGKTIVVQGGAPRWITPESGTATDVLLQLADSKGLTLIGRVPTITALREISPSFLGWRIDVIEYDIGYGVGGGYFVSVEKGALSDDGGKYIDSGSSAFIWKRESYPGPVLPEWYGCRGLGSTVPDTDAFALMLAGLDDNDTVLLRPGADYHNSMPNGVSDNWKPTKNGITFFGQSSTLSRRASTSETALIDAGIAVLECVGLSNISLLGDLRITGNEMLSEIYDNAGNPLNSGVNYCRGYHITFCCEFEDCTGIEVGESVKMERSVFLCYANGCSDITANGKYNHSGQRWPLTGTDIQVGSAWKFNNCSGITGSATGRSLAYSLYECESNNNSGSLSGVGFDCYHSTIHFHNGNSGFDIRSIAHNNKIASAYISGGANAISGSVVGFSTGGACLHVVGTDASPVRGCKISVAAYNCGRAITTFGSDGGTSAVKNCKFDIVDDADTIQSGIAVYVSNARRNKFDFLTSGHNTALLVSGSDFNEFHGIAPTIGGFSSIQAGHRNAYKFSYSTVADSASNYIDYDLSVSASRLYGRANSATTSVQAESLFSSYDYTAFKYMPNLSSSSDGAGIPSGCIYRAGDNVKYKI
ncbi:hypothetical protein [Pectobacterium aroidearum]|uniref:hypothetical protein n=1 Tax=Pectobacterium aroidearum TaxID=1201031 RepID=UPI001CD4274B|nr:hypothetical protein [Pectobacterium aroidearum]